MIIFDSESPKQIREQINPNIVVRGGEFTADEIRERDNIPNEIDIKIFPLVHNRSTSEVIRKIKNSD